MTVVAATLKEMAADSLVTAGSDKWHTCKLYRMDDGTICGVAGCGGEAVVEWIKRGGRKGDEPAIADSDFYVLHLRFDGLYLYCNSVIPDKLKAKNHAIGCGAKVALYAMRKLKKSPKEACEAAIEVDHFCGGEVDVMRL